MKTNKSKPRTPLEIQRYWIENRGNLSHDEKIDLAKEYLGEHNFRDDSEKMFGKEPEKNLFQQQDRNFEYRELIRIMEYLGKFDWEDHNSERNHLDPILNEIAPFILEISQRIRKKEESEP